MKSVSIKKKTYTNADGFKEKMIVVERKYNDRKTETEIIGSRLEKAEWQERLLRDYQAGKMKEGEYVALKAFDNSAMARSNTISLEGIMKYESQIKYNDDPEKVREGLRLVIIKVKDLRDFDANTQDHKQKRRQKYQRTKKEKATQTKKLTGRVKRK